MLSVFIFSEATELVFPIVKPQTAEANISFVSSPLKRSHASPLSGIPYGDNLRLSDAAKRLVNIYSREMASLKLRCLK